MRLLINLFEQAQWHQILRPLRAGERRLHGTQIEFQHLGVVGSGGALITPQALRLGVGFDQRNLLRWAAGELQVTQRFFIDRKNAAGAAVLGRHIGNRGAICQR